MLLFILASFRVLVPENEVYLQHAVKLKFEMNTTGSYLIRGTALVGTKHDDIGRGVGKFLRV